MAKSVGADLDFENVARILNLPNPSSAQHPATKGYVDSAVEGLAWKDNVRVSTQGNINLASPGATIDGITMVANDRVLVRAQTTGSENGLYLWNGAAVAMTRSADANTFDELEQAVVSVDEGTNAGTSWRQTAVNGTIGSTTVTWGAFGTSAPNASTTVAGLVELADQTETDAGSDATRAVTPSTLAAWSGRVRRYAATIGDNSATEFAVTHNLGTRDVHVGVYAAASPYDEPLCEIEHTSTTVCTVRFASAPTTNEFRVVVLG